MNASRFLFFHINFSTFFHKPHSLAFIPSLIRPFQTGHRGNKNAPSSGARTTQKDDVLSCRLAYINLMQDSSLCGCERFNFELEPYYTQSKTPVKRYPHASYPSYIIYRFYIVSISVREINNPAFTRGVIAKTHRIPLFVHYIIAVLQYPCRNKAHYEPCEKTGKSRRYLLTQAPMIRIRLGRNKVLINVFQSLHKFIVRRFRGKCTTPTKRAPRQ